MCALTSKQDLYSAAGVCADGHQAAEQQMAASALMEELQTPRPGAGAQPSFSSAMSGTVFYSKVDKRAANKKKLCGSQKKRKEK